MPTVQDLINVLKMYPKDSPILLGNKFISVSGSHAEYFIEEEDGELTTSFDEYN